MLVPLHKKSAAEATKQFSVELLYTSDTNSDGLLYFLETSDTKVLLGSGVGTCGR